MKRKGDHHKNGNDKRIEINGNRGSGNEEQKERKTITNERSGIGKRKQPPDDQNKSKTK